MSFGAISAAALLFLLSQSTAIACTCLDHIGEKRVAAADQLARAAVVAKGHVTSARVAHDLVWPRGAEKGFMKHVAGQTPMSARIVSAEFIVSEALKGQVSRTITLLTGFGMGDCGIGGGLFGAVAIDKPITIELHAIKGTEDRYVVNQCGYLELEN